MTTIKLDIDFLQEELYIIGVSCQEKDYRLVWGLNEYAEFNFHRLKQDLASECGNYLFPVYEQNNEESAYRVIANLFAGQYFMKELKGLDYLFLISGDESVEEIIERIQRVPFIFSVDLIDISMVKNYKRLLF